MKTPSTAMFMHMVYDILVNLGGAHESYRPSFVHNHSDPNDSCEEWRFQGILGYGGKYYSRENRVNCYQEDVTPERGAAIIEINNALEKLLHNYIG